MLTLRGPAQTGGKPCRAARLVRGTGPAEPGSGVARRPHGRVLSHARSLRLRRALDARQPIAESRSRTTRTTVVTEDPGTDLVTISARAPHPWSSADAASSSSAADEPFIA